MKVYVEYNSCFPLHESKSEPVTLNATILTDLWALTSVDWTAWAI